MQNENEKQHDADSLEPIPEAGLLGKAISRVSDLFAIGILASAAILIIEVFLRYVFVAPTVWGHETVVFLIGSSFIFGGLVVAARDAHIRVVLLYDNLSKQWRRVFDVTISALCAISALFFTLATWTAVKRSLFTPAGDFRIETSGTAFNAPYPGLQRLFLFIVLSILTVQFIVMTINYFRGKK